MVAPKDPFKAGRKKAGKKAAAAKAKDVAKGVARTQPLREVLQLAMPIPGPQKAKAAAKVVGAVAKKVRKPRSVVLIANRGSDETMAKIAKNQAIKANMRKGAASPEKVKETAAGIRKMLNEKDPAKRKAMSKRLGKGKKI